MIVYCVRCIPSGHNYVGQTIRTLKARWYMHVYDASVKNSELHLHRAIRKYGSEAFQHEILQECQTQEELDTAEIAWIEKLGTFGQGGLNETRGGRGIRIGHQWGPQSDEHRERIRVARRGKCTGASHPMFNGHPRQKLKLDDIVAIKSTSVDVSHETLATLYHVTVGHIYNVRFGRTWKHVRPDLTKDPTLFYRGHNGYTVRKKHDTNSI